MHESLDVLAQLADISEGHSKILEGSLVRSLAFRNFLQLAALQLPLARALLTAIKMTPLPLHARKILQITDRVIYMKL